MTRGLKMKTSLPMKHVDKGWGWERWVVNCEEYCGKLLFFEKLFLEKSEKYDFSLFSGFLNGSRPQPTKC